MDVFVQKVSLEEYLELRKNLDFSDVSTSGLVNIYYKSPQPITYKNQVHRFKRYQPKYF